MKRQAVCIEWERFLAGDGRHWLQRLNEAKDDQARQSIAYQIYMAGFYDCRDRMKQATQMVEVVQ